MSNATAAALYDQHAGRYGRELGRALVGVAPLEPGYAVLDVGCGTGRLTAILAEVVGPPRVAAIDPSGDFVAACRRRVPGADVRVASAEVLPFDNASFDAAFAQLVVNLLPDPVAGVHEMRRVTRPGGTVVACVWDRQRMPLLQAFWESAAAVVPDRVRGVRHDQQVGEPGPERLAERFEAAGLADLRTGALEVSADYEGFGDLWRPFAAGIGRSGALCASLDDSGRRQLEAAVREHLGVQDGPFSLTARAWYAVGARSR